MADLVVVVPSRSRPEAAHELVEAFADTCAADTYLNFVVDLSDPQAYDYPAGCGSFRNGLTFSPGSSMVDALNHAALALLSDFPSFAIGFCGDDHRPRTQGWDKAYLDALHELGTGIVYGDDLLQGENLPTQCAMTSDIVRTLGYMAPPTLQHMYVDNAWLALGQELGRIRYLPDVVVEHLHPIAGKAEWDDGYRRVNDRSMYARDRAMFHQWLRDSLPVEAERIRKIAA